MHVISNCNISQSTREEGTRGLIELIEFICAAWDKFERSSRRSMNELVVPKHIAGFTVGGVVYQLESRRKLWFERTATGYNRDYVYVSEAIGEDGHPYQLKLDLRKGNSYDDVCVVRAQLLGVPQQRRTSYAHTGSIALV